MMGAAPALITLQAEGSGGDPFSFLLPMLAIFLIFYFLLIRPQQRRQREHESMLKAIEKGDTVVTTGGLHGKVTGVTDEVLTLEIASVRGEKVRVKVARTRIESRVKGGGGEEA